jgi:AraC-like DNA-binding protein
LSFVRLCQLGAIAGGVAAALKGWRADLMNRRRLVRLVVMVLCGLGLLAMILDDYYLVSLRTLESPLLLGVNAFVVSVLLGAHFFLASNRDILIPAPRPPLAEEADQTPPPDTDADSVALTRLNRAMTVDRLFTTEGLTLGDLAGKLHLPEYRLRQIINQRLGYRNFNQFLADHRVALAKAKLADPANQNDKIISIAFDVGYGSLAPFNKAFKDLTGLTPSAYRAAALKQANSSSQSTKNMDQA